MRTTSEATSEDGLHEIHLSGKQLVFLCMATTVVSVVIFLCGVLVGRGVRAAQGDPSMVASAASLPTSGVPEGADRVQPGPTDAAPADELSYPDRLEEAEPAREVLGGTSGSTPPAAAEKPAAQHPPAPPAPAPAAPPAAAAPPASPIPSAPPGKGFAVQIAAVPTRPEADQIAARLTGKGYPVYVIDPVAGGNTTAFRIRVGTYPDKQQAEEMARRLEKDEQLKSTWITR